MSSGEYSTTQETMVLPLLQQKNIIGRPFITVSGIGRQTNTSTYLNGGADFGPDTLSGATDLGQYGPPYSTSLGAAEAKTYGNKYNKAVYYVTSQTFSFLESLYNILNGDIVKATVTVGTNPYGVAITPDSSYVYIVNYGSGTVSVIEISSNTVTATVTVGTNPVGVAITPDGNYAYVVNYGSGTVSVIDISTNTVTTTVTVGTDPKVQLLFGISDDPRFHDLFGVSPDPNAHDLLGESRLLRYLIRKFPSLSRLAGSCGDVTACVLFGLSVTSMLGLIISG